MTNSMNIPEIETLYHHRSLFKCPECKQGFKPPSAPREVKKKTTPDIEPKTQAKNKESVGQPTEQPNQQIMLIKTIQGLTTAILHDISKLPESVLKDQAYDDMNIFETGILFRLQKEYE